MTAEEKIAHAEKYPEHTKLRAVKDRSQELGAFLEWLEYEKNYTICKVLVGDYLPVERGIQDILAEYFGIDLVKIEEEKRLMLDELRAKDL